MSLKLEDLSPYLDRESAVEWLRRDLGDGTAVSRKAMYHLNIINHFLQNDQEILKRLPSPRLGGLPEGGRRNVAASCILRASEGAGGTQQESIRDSGFTLTQERVGLWAERDGCWADYAGKARTAAGYRYLDSGSEADVYLDGEGYCHKNIDISHYGSLQGLMDRIAIHNAVFPEAAMTVEGFGLKDDAEFNDGYCVMVRQPFILGDRASQEEIIRHMEAAGFSLIGKDTMEVVQEDAASMGLKVPQFSIFFRFISSDGVHVHDLNDLNVVTSPKGNLMVFDCDVTLNRDPGRGHVHGVPPVEFSESAVRKIGGLLDHIAPMQMDRLEFEMMYDNPKSKIHDQLRDRGRCEDLVDVSGTPCLVALDPADDENVLILPHDSAALMSRLSGDFNMTASQRADVARGLTVRLDRRTTVVFDLDKGRPVKVTQRSKYQGTVESARQKESIPELSKNTLKR